MKTVIKKCAWIFIPVIAIFLLNFGTTNDIRVDKIIKQLEIFRINYWQQKVNLHTDKDRYLAGEDIWIKCYLVNAFTFMPDTISKEIYVDLIDCNNKRVQSIILRNKAGFSDGNISINDSLADGNYQLRVYTSWMRNFDSDFFYNKNIKITNPNYENVITSRKLADIKKLNRKYEEMLNDYLVNFFPEGGDLVSGFESKVAFKAENKLGNAIDITGSLYSESGEKIIDFQSTHLGMGSFSFTPKAGVRYYAKVIFNNSKKESNFELPKILESGISMAVDPFSPRYIRVNIHSNRTVSSNIADNEIVFVGQARGNALYVSKGELRDKQIEVLIPKEIFPSGVVQLTVFDAKLEPMCERLVFVDYNKDLNENTLIVSKQVEGNSSKYFLKLTKKDGTQAVGNVSFSVCETLQGETITDQTNILTNLLLTSDLKGRIENPAYYFSGNKGTRTNLDLVMLTHGWRRFVWTDVLSNNFPKIKYLPSQGISIEGKVTHNAFSSPVVKGKVQLSVLSSYNDVYEATTNSKGQFLFTGLDYEGEVNVKIDAFKPSGGSGGFISVNDSLAPTTNAYTNLELQSIVFPKDKMNANNKRERYKNREMLKNRPAGQSTQMGKIHETPNDAIQVGDDASNYGNILQYMQGRIPGVNINGNRVIIRGVSTLNASSDPLFLIDGIAVDVAALSSINPGDVASIEVLKGPNASIYGSRGANGVIAFYSKRGEFVKSGAIDLVLKGYHKTKAFYVPTYDLWQFKPQNYKIPRTLYWKPNVITKTNGEVFIEFENSFKIENAIVTIEGITNSGEIIYYQDSVK